MAGSALTRAAATGRGPLLRMSLMLLVLAVLLAACGQGDDPAAEDEDDTAGETEGDGEDEPDEGDDVAGEPGGDLRVVVPAEPRALHRELDNNLSSIGIGRLVVEHLVADHPETYHETTDGLVTAFEQVDDLTWTFSLREGVTFHNGEPFDAEAAAYNVLRSRDDATGAAAPYFQLIEDAVAADDHTLEITTSDPAPYLSALMMNVQVFAPGYHGEVGDEEFGRAPVGTGPFVFEDWVEGQSITLARYDDYYREPALVDTVTFSFASEASTRVALVQTGDADVTNRVPPQVDQELEGDPAVTVARVPAVMKILLWFNLDDPPLDDIRVRQAVAHAIDRDLIVDAVFEGVGAVADPNLFHPMFSSAGGHDDDYLDYDPDRARELLEEAGDVGPIDFHWPVGRYLLDNEVGEAISGMLEQAGFQVNRQPAELGAFFELLLTDDMSGMHLLGSAPTFAHEDGPLASYIKESGVITYCADGSTDDLAEEALLLPPGSERDALYNQIERRLIIDLVCPVPLYIQTDSFALSDRVAGFEPRGDEAWDNLRLVSLDD